jgi:hypothetical protein
MIAKIRRWRKLSRLEEGLRISAQFDSDTGPEQPVQPAIPGCSGQKNSLRDGAPSSVMSSEMLQLRETLPRGTYRPRRRRVAMAEDQAIWQGRLRSSTKTEGRTSWRDRLRPRPDVVGASRDRTKATKPRGVAKRRKASKKTPQAATPGPKAKYSVQGADNFGISSPQSLSTESSPQGIITVIANTRRKNIGRRSPCETSTAESSPQAIPTVQSGGVRKDYYDKGRRRREPYALTTKRNQALLHLLTPPPSD